MPPITWQNIRGPSLAEASRPMEVAQRSLDNMFDKFNGVLQQREATDAANWNTAKTNNTNQVLNAVNQYATPEEFAAAQKAGAIQALMGGMGAQVDQQAVRAAQDGRLGVLQQRAKQGIDYRNTVTDDAAAPLEDAFNAAAIKGDKAEMDRIQSVYAGRNRAKLLGFADEREQVGVNRERNTTEFGWKGDKQKMDMRTGESNLLTDVAQRRLIGAQTNATQMNAEANQAEALSKQSGGGSKGEAARLDAAYKEMVATGPLSMGTFDTAEGKKNLMEALKNFPGVDEGDAKDILYNLGKYYDKGITVNVENAGTKNAKAIKLPLPVATIIEELGKSSDNPLAIGFSRRGDNLVNNIDKRFGLYSTGYRDPALAGKEDRELIDNMTAVEQIRAARASILGRYAAQPNQPQSPSEAGKKKSPDQVVANAAVGTPEASTPVAVPSRIDGKPATATHFSLNTGKSGSAKPIAPVEIPEDTNWQKPTVAVQAKRPGGEKAIVTYVGDGDGATLKRKDGSEINCRIDTIDAPETAKPRYGKPGQPFGEESKRTLQGMIERKEVTLRVTRPAGEGNYDRALCKIEVEGVGVDAKMLQAGAAWLYRRYASDDALSDMEDKAKKTKKGLWADPDAENPETFRRRINK